MAFFMAGGMMTGCGFSPGQTEESSAAADLRPVMELTREDKRTSPHSPKNIDLRSAGEELLITDAGDYRLSGDMNGSIHIRAEEQIVHLFLCGVNVKSVTAPAINVESAGKLIITAEDGSDNIFADGSKFIDDISDACIFSMCDLTINGGGSVSVSGYYKDAIHTKDTLRISGVRLFVRAKDDGLLGNDAVMSTGADVSVEAEKNGIRTTKTGKALKGNIEITGSGLSVIAGEHALNASRSIYMASSRAFLKGVMSNTKADAEIFIGEGCLTNG